MSALPSTLRDRIGQEGIRLRPVLFQQGVNEMQTVANSTLSGYLKTQAEINNDSLKVQENHIAS